jgi:uncharacterized membrane protein YhaH (DUF805 family)
MTVWDWYVRRGRISRSTYVLQYLLPIVLAPLAAGWVDRAMGLPQVAMVAESGWFILQPAGLLEQTVFVLLLVPAITGSVARLHDRSNSAWFLLLLLIPVVGALLLVVACVSGRGDLSHNDYGPVPAPMRRPRVIPGSLGRRIPA